MPTSRFLPDRTHPVAERILALAKAHGLAPRGTADVEAMLAAVMLGEPVPVAAFAVVAEILFHVLKANGSLPDGAEQGA